MSTLRRIGARLALVLGGILAGLLLVEGWFRLRQPLGPEAILFNAPGFSPLDLYDQVPELITSPHPGWTGWISTMEYRTRVSINELGLRGPELEDKGDALRILAVGDSFTMSVQVDLDDTFQSVLAEGLEERLDRPVEVLNGGVDGYGSQQATLRVERLADAAELDAAVLVFFLGNDFYDNANYQHLARSLQGRPLEAIPDPPPMPLWIQVMGRLSYAYAYWEVTQATRFHAANPKGGQMRRYREELEIFTESRGKLRNRYGPPTDKALRRFAEVCDGKGLRCFVTLAPAAWQVHEERQAATFELVGLGDSKPMLDTPALWATEAAEGAGLPVLDLTPSLREAADEPLYLVFDGHWNERGHEVVGEALVHWLAEEL